MRILIIAVVLLSLITVILLSAVILAYAGDFVTYDNNGYITGKHRSVSNHLFHEGIIQCDNYLQIDRATYNSLTRWHKVDNGQIVEMTLIEKDIINQANILSQEQAAEKALQRYEVSNLELLTALVQRINVRIPSNPITKAEVIQQIKDNR